MCPKLISTFIFFHLDEILTSLSVMRSLFSYPAKVIATKFLHRIVLKNCVMISGFTTSETAVKPFAVTKWPCPRHNHQPDQSMALLYCVLCFISCNHYQKEGNKLKHRILSFYTLNIVFSTVSPHKSYFIRLWEPKILLCLVCGHTVFIQEFLGR